MIKSKVIYLYALTLINGFSLQFTANANMNELENFLSTLNENEKFQ